MDFLTLAQFLYAAHASFRCELNPSLIVISSSIGAFLFAPTYVSNRVVLEYRFPVEIFIISECPVFRLNKHCVLCPCDFFNPFFLLTYVDTFMYRRRRYRPRRRRKRLSTGYGRSSRGRSRYGMSFARRVRRVVQAELKFQIGGFQVSPVVGAPSQVDVTNIALGQTQTTRIGNWIRPVTIHGNIVVNGDITVPRTADTYGIRIGYAVWKNDESSDPFSAARIMQVAASPGGPFNILEKGAFQVLWSRFLVVVNNTDNSQVTKKLRFKINLGRIPKTLYDGANQKKYQIFFFALSDDVTGTQPVTIFVDHVFRYTDS